MKWKQYLAGLCGFIFGFWMCMPRNVVLLPRYEVLVVDSSGIGFPSAVVKQVRMDYAITGAVSSSLAIGDSYGRVAFSPVRGRTSPLFRLIFCAGRKINHGVHTPCGYRQEITVDVPGEVESSRFESDLPLKGRGRLIRIMMRATGSKQ